MILYNQISEIPLHNWEQLNITGDYRWLVVKGFGIPKEEDIENAFFDMQDQAAPITGAQEFLEKWRILILKRMEARQMVAEGNKAAQNKVELFTAMIEQLMSGATDSDIIKNRLAVQKMWGQPIDAKNTSYLEFLKIRQLVEEEHTQIKSRQDGEN